MVSQNKLPEAVDNIKKRLFPEEQKPYRAGKILWIIRQYIKYSMLATVHGYPVGPIRKGFFRLVVSYWEYVPWHLRRKLIFSEKAFGHEFKIVFDSPIMRKHKYYFNPNFKWKKMIKELIETDKVYKLIPDR